MKIIGDRSRNKYRYFCDRCGKEISFDNHTLHQIIDKYGERTSHKRYDLCDRCLRMLDNGVRKHREKLAEENINSMNGEIE